jgi:sterol desaturase/sphingolipid hydroxylase (fatty acid hydroxylase superfamily)
MESVWELRERKQKRTRRMFINGLFAVPGFVALRLLLLPTMVWIAYQNESLKFGISYLFDLPLWLEGAIVFILLDYTNYLWHILNHKVPLLWRFHLVHHTDIDLDLTTAIRFHAGEMVTSIFYRGLAVFITGASPMQVLIYEIFFEGATLFHHSNWRLPIRLERVLNLLIVTPRMHGIHHSVKRSETDSNYSVIFSFWDRIHGSVNLNIPQRAISTGVPVYDDPKELTVGFLLKLPFTKIRKWESIAPPRGKENKNHLIP